MNLPVVARIDGMRAAAREDKINGIELERAFRD